jgi:hypothetical protein
MKTDPKTMMIGCTMMLAAVMLFNGCNESDPDKREGSSGAISFLPKPRVPAGTSIQVALGSTISSETANAGDSWHGKVTNDVVTNGKVVIPAGSSVSGTVVSSVEAKRGSRAMLDLAVRNVTVNGRSQAVSAGAEEVIAGSTRARNLGAIAGGAAAGALIGKAVGDGKNGAVGGLIGGAAATGVVAASKGWQVVLKEGTVMSFTVVESISMR